SRAGLVDTDALIAALEAGRIRGAGLDVHDLEPLPVDHRLRSTPRTVLTPHLGYVTEDTYRIFFAQAVENIAAWAKGQPIRVIGGRRSRASVHLGGIARAAAAVLQGVDGRHLGIGEIEVEDVEVLLHPIAIVRLREEDVSLLQVPPDDRLGPGLLMGGGDIGDDGAGVVDLALAQRSP